MNSEANVNSINDALISVTDDIKYWVRLHRILFEVDLKIFNKCAQKVLFLSRSSANTNVVHVACASALNYLMQNLEPHSTRSIQKLLFTYPNDIASWAIFIAAFLPRFVIFSVI